MQEVTEQLREMGKEVAPECDHPQQGGDSVAVDQDRRDIHMPQNVIQILQQLASLSTPEQKASIVPVRGAVLDVNGGPMYSPSSECLHEASMSPSQNPSSIVRHLTRLQEITAAAAALTHSEQPASISQADVMETPPPEVDPTTIVEWRQGLRHASKLGIQGPELKICMKKVGFQQFSSSIYSNYRK